MMKLSYKVVALLVALLVMMSMVPVSSFAEDNAEPKPIKIEFKPAEGFVVPGMVGVNEFEEEDFYGEGNSFEMTYEKLLDTGTETYTVEYKYVKDVDGEGNPVEGFFEAGDIRNGKLDIVIDDYDEELKKGKHEIELTWIDYVEWQDDPITLKFKTTVSAEKYDLYCEWHVYNYTGKVVKPKFVVRRMYDNKVVPASQYTYKTPKNKKMGYYDVNLKFKDEYKDMYVEPVISATYGIGPTKPVVKSAKGGKKSITVKWKKFTTKQLKTVDGMHIFVAKDKNFHKVVKTFRVTGKTLKSGKKVLKAKAIKAKKKYYVRMFTYKEKVKQGSYTFSMQSDDSNVKAAKTK